jgi:hypothetical protein
MMAVLASLFFEMPFVVNNTQEILTVGFPSNFKSTFSSISPMLDGIT